MKSSIFKINNLKVATLLSLGFGLAFLSNIYLLLSGYIFLELDPEIVKQKNFSIIFLLSGLLFLCIWIIAARKIVSIVTGRLNIFSEFFRKLASGKLTSRYAIENINCSQVKNCNNPSCPEFGKDNVLCFFTVGSFATEFGFEVHCPSILKGKIKSCRECTVFARIANNEFNDGGLV